MKTDDQNTQNLLKQLGDLSDEAKKINQEINDINQESKEAMNSIEADVNASIKSNEKLFSELDQMEKEVGDELDELVINEIKDLF